MQWIISTYWFSKKGLSVSHRKIQTNPTVIHRNLYIQINSAHLVDNYSNHCHTMRWNLHFIANGPSISVQLVFRMSLGFFLIGTVCAMFLWQFYEVFKSDVLIHWSSLLQLLTKAKNHFTVYGLDINTYHNLWQLKIIGYFNLVRYRWKISDMGYYDSSMFCNQTSLSAVHHHSNPFYLDTPILLMCYVWMAEYFSVHLKSYWVIAFE